MTQIFGYSLLTLLTFTFFDNKSNIIHGKQDGKLKQGNLNKSSHTVLAFIVLILWYIPACLKSKQ